jgi:hypothetical protein
MMRFLFVIAVRAQCDATISATGVDMVGTAKFATLAFALNQTLSALPSTNNISVTICIDSGFYSDPLVCRIIELNSSQTEMSFTRTTEIHLFSNASLSLLKFKHYSISIECYSYE